MVAQLLETHNSVWLSSQNIAVRAHKVESRGFVGISCTAYADESRSYRTRQSDDFACTDLKADGEDDDNSDVRAEDKVRVLIATGFLLFTNAGHVKSVRTYCLLVCHKAVTA